MLEFGPILPDIDFQLLKVCGRLCHIFHLMMNNKYSLYVKDLDCRQANSAPRLFYYEAMLL